MRVVIYQEPRRPVQKLVFSLLSVSLWHHGTTLSFCWVLLPTSCCCFLLTGAVSFSVSVVTSVLSAAVGGDDGAAVSFWSGCLSGQTMSDSQ